MQTLFDQYLHLYQKANIYLIKKLHKLLKQIANYVHGFIMKKQTATQDPKDKEQGMILERNQQIISANILKMIVKHGLIREAENHSVEHDDKKVDELLHNSSLKHIALQDLVLD